MKKKKILWAIVVVLLPMFGYAQGTTTNPDTVCAGDLNVPYWLNGTTGSTYNWTVKAPFGTLLNGNGTDSINIDWGLTTGLVDSAIVVIETDSNGCTGAPVPLDVFISPVPTALAGADNDTCGNTYQLDATASLGTGTWSTVSAGVTFSNVNSPTSTVTITTYGAHTFTWTEDNNGCIDADDVEITFIEIPVVNAGADDFVCVLSYNLGATQTVGSGTWSEVTGDVSFVLDTDPNTTATSTSYGVYELVWSVDNGGCITRDTIEISFLEQPVADAGADNNACGLTYNLAATASVGTGTWTSTDPGAVFNNANSPATSVTVSGYGTVTFTWTETNGGCSDADDVVITFINNPTADAGANGDACGLTYTLTGTTPPSGSGTWSSTVPGVTFNTPSDPNTSVTIPANSYGAYTFTWTVTDVSCTSSDDVIITFYENPVADAGPDDDICGNEYTLNANASVGTGTWTASIGGVIYDNANLPGATATVPSAGQTVTFTWTEDNNGCISADPVDITFNAPPTTSPIIHN